MNNNAYLIVDEATNKSALVDCPLFDEKMEALIGDTDLQYILLTHGHFDHITGVDRLVSLTGAPVYAGERERELMMNAGQNGSRMAGYELSVDPDILLKDGQTLCLAGMEFEVIFTPGHTVGSCCFYEKSEAVLFSGDTIFMESVGRTDFPTGSSRELIASVREKVLVLPENVKIYPGHGPETTVGYEKQYNPYA